MLGRRLELVFTSEKRKRIRRKGKKRE